ncbi:MAG TPA: cbb3-type cytochrome oxidase assembly protein CcoS [Cryomorphaceae bacterium]|nr:cbb3-type cytochrome oxidase assembly protein CcoS [Cryomorphaceae bacterium]
MEALFLLIGISLAVAVVFLLGFLWAVRSKQYEDDFTPSVRILFEDDVKKRGAIDRSASSHNR